MTPQGNFILLRKVKTLLLTVSAVFLEAMRKQFQHFQPTFTYLVRAKQ